MGMSTTPLFRFRVLAERDSAYNVYVARCLETGSVTTADDIETAKEMMWELLDDEVSYAIAHENFASLLSSPASPDVWKRWIEAANAKGVEEIELRVIDAQKLSLGSTEVSTEISLRRVA
jgi:hypothetical protein